MCKKYIISNHKNKILVAKQNKQAVGLRNFETGVKLVKDSQNVETK